MKIEGLKEASDLYMRITNFELRYLELRRATDPELDLGRPDHRGALLSWLNQWGCRQFKISDHHVASSNILSWYKLWAARLPAREQRLCDLSEGSLEDLALAYDALRHKIASHQERSTRPIRKTVGPTGASKILFALRPRVAVAWDMAMRRESTYKDGSAYNYQDFLVQVRDDLADLARECEEGGFPLCDLPDCLGRAKSTLPQLVGEYYYLRAAGRLPQREKKPL